ncbi:Protein argonaute-2 [Cichlidogyrus casuarinus]|uniref:Protein argonaute-2 n=1 Tax=Cichlidogyrus casuarinus TaxID=1844966 RepID=A0ABD2PSG5_9PLAT
MCGKDNVILGRNAVFEAEPQAKNQHPEKHLSIYRGNIASVRAQWKIFLNIDTTYKGFMTPGNVADVLYGKHHERLYENYNWDRIFNPIRLLKVRQNYHTLKKPNGDPIFRTYTVHGYSKESAQSLKIPGIDKTIKQYFEDDLGLKLEYPELPCLKVSKDKEVYIPLEKLDILPFQTAKDMQADITSTVIRCAAVRPNYRFDEIEAYAKKIVTENTLFDKYGVSLDVNENTRRIPARILPAPNLDHQNKSNKVAQGFWRQNTFKHTPQKALRWAILSVSSRQHDRRAIETIRRHFAHIGGAKGCRVISGQPFSVSETNFLGIRRELVNCMNSNVDIAIIILNNQDLSYNEIKKFGDQENGMVTQCVRSSTLNRTGVVENLWLKINGKLGGVNWEPDYLVRQSEKNPIMVVGADVTHMASSFGGDKKSVAAVVASYTSNLMRYKCEVTEQPMHERGTKVVRETIESMREIMVRLLKNFFSENGQRYPEKIVVYRDGVSEGQFINVLVKELDGIQKACLDLCVNPLPKITYIVVVKRHLVRLMAPDVGSGDRNKNLLPGTVVDTDITHPRDFEFFLCSHHSIQGTAKAARYYVLYDDNNYSSDQLQTLSYALCFAYMRCSRSVSIPAPTYYAHLAAARAREWMKTRQGELMERDASGNAKFFQIHNLQRNAMFFL